MHNKNPQKGFTILVAVVTAGILLIIAMSIGGIALKEQVLSTANKESQIAFYAADTGMECAMYWDQNKVNGGKFAPTTDTNGNIINQTGTPSINCNNNVTPSIITKDVSPPSGYDYSYTFMVSGIKVGYGSATTCSVVKISKDTHTDSNRTKTFVQAYGYNTCEASLTRLERGIEGHY